MSDTGDVTCSQVENEVMDELDEQFEDEYRYNGGGSWSSFAKGVNFIQREVRVNK